jgi:hypothetical protein
LPIISFDTNEFDLGSITQGEIVKKTFTFKNVGNDDLEIISVIPDCSFTSPKSTEEIIKPGESGFISSEYDSHEIYCATQCW